MKISGADLTSFFKAKNSSIKCSYCDSDDWTIPSDNKIADSRPDDDLAPQIFFPTIYNMDGTKTIEGVQLLPMSCANCGNTRLQNINILLTWLKERDA
jgi:hypothetical protein